MHIHATQLEPGSIKPLWLKERAEIDIVVPPEARVLVSITVLHLHGTLDGSTYETLVAAAGAEMDTGASRVIIDLENVEALSSAGAIGIYMVGALLEGEPIDNLEGYAVMGRMRHAIDQGQPFSSLFLAAPCDRVAQALAASGLERLAAAFPSVDEAISAFPAESASA